MKWSDWLLVIGLMGLALIEGIRVAMGHTHDLRDFTLRIVFVVGILFWAISYDTIRTDPNYKKACGGIEILISAVLTWMQLTKIGELGWQQENMTDRFALLIGCVALMSKGMKDWYSDEA